MGDVSIADVSSAELTEPRSFHLADEAAFPIHTLGTGNGLTLKALANGCVFAFEHGEILINQVLASPLGGGIHRIYLRIISDGVIRAVEIVGPGAGSTFTALADRFSWRGACEGISYHCQCWLPPLENTWVFQVEVKNSTGNAVKCDTILVQDIGLATRGQSRNNERYTSQYLDHRAEPHKALGHLLISRQNLPQPNGVNPLLMQGCLPKVAGFTTDGFDFFGLHSKENGIPLGLSRPIIGSRIRQYEAAYTAIQSGTADLPPAARHTWSFFSRFFPHHPDPSSAADFDNSFIQKIGRLCVEHAGKTEGADLLSGSKPPTSLFQTAPLFESHDLDETEIRRLFPGELRHPEFDGPRRLSFFCGEDSRHVILKAKELIVERSHGHIMRSGQGLTPDAEVMSCSFYAPGVFASQMTLGNTVLGKFLSPVRDPLNIIRSSGLRMFVRSSSAEPWRLLAMPSAYEMAPHFCRWYYKNEADLLTVTCRSSDDDPAFVFTISTVKASLELLICGEILAGPQEFESSPKMTIDGRRARIGIRPNPKSILAEGQPNLLFNVVSSTPHAIKAIGGDEMVCGANASPTLPVFAIRTYPTMHFSLSFLGVFDSQVRAESLCAKYESVSSTPAASAMGASDFWQHITGRFRISGGAAKNPSDLQDSMQWMARDAIVHMSIPRGLEQANGGAWGVRDVCQGPMEFLISHDRIEVIKTLLIELFSQQYRVRGDWPQWFMFPPFQKIQSTTCHGDILIWPLKALCDYLEQSDDGTILEQQVPFTDEKTLQRGRETKSILQHVDLLLEKLRSSFLPGLSLPRYGEGDWDDSLQPKRENLAEQMVSSWTSALIYQTLRRYAVALNRYGMKDRAESIDGLAEGIQADFQRFMMPDGVVAGFAVFGEKAGQVDHYLLHPRDSVTGLHYRLISMTRGIISGIFTPKQAGQHLDLVHEHLLAPDGARLMDRPTRYQGGLETIFRRSESASFFGREIGLQYIHAHLRYAEALAAMGKGEELIRALRVANPIAVTQIVKNARLRQRNCYFSSSDAAFTDRYEASRDYDKVKRGEIPVDGGWRIYSSGPGIYTNLVIRQLFGLRHHFDCVELDPVIPREFSGVCCEMSHGNRKVRYEFIRSNGHPRNDPVLINGAVPRGIMRPAGRYRQSGIRITKSDFESALTREANIVRIET